MGYLDNTGLAYFWQKVKDYVAAQIQAVGALTGVKGDAESTYRTGNVNLTAANIGAAASSHSHAISDVTNLQTTLNGKAASSHSHAIADVTDLQDELDGKAASSHNHAASNITSGTLGVARGGTGKASHTINSILTGGTTTTGAVQDVATASGALYATAANGAAKFGTLPIAQGGTGATSAADAWDALGGGAIGKKDSLAASDIPNHSTSKLTSGTLGIARGGTGFTSVKSVLSNETRTVFVWGKLVMVQLHGAQGTPSATTVLNSGTLASYKPKYNASAIVADTSGHLARLWVNASNGNISLAAVNYTTSSTWYGTLVYMLE